MDLAVNRRPRNAKSSFISAFVVEKVAMVQVLVGLLRLSPVTIIPPFPHRHLFVYRQWYIILAHDYSINNTLLKKCGKVRRKDLTSLNYRASKSTLCFNKHFLIQ